MKTITRRTPAMGSAIARARTFAPLFWGSFREFSTSGMVNWSDVCMEDDRSVVLPDEDGCGADAIVVFSDLEVMTDPVDVVILLDAEEVEVTLVNISRDDVVDVVFIPADEDGRNEVEVEGATMVVGGLHTLSRSTESLDRIRQLKSVKSSLWRHCESGELKSGSVWFSEIIILIDSWNIAMKSGKAGGGRLLPTFSTGIPSHDAVVEIPTACRATWKHNQE